MRTVVVGVLLLLPISVAAAASTSTIAVMPFADLSGKGGKAGEALRETVTADLAEVPNVRVLERARIDQVIAETNLGAKKTDLDPIASVRVGTLLGATWIVAGAYQQAGDTVRLTARMIKVQTGEVTAGAKADGKVADFFRLQDRLTTQLLVAAGLRSPAPAPARPRFALRSWRAVEVYADAVVETDPTRKQKLLETLLAEDPSFVYARRDLDALLGRLNQYAETARVQLTASEAEALRKLAAHPAAAERVRQERALFTAMITARRYHSLEQATDQLIAAAGNTADDDVVYARFIARNGLHKFDLALQNGEAYLKAFPTGKYFAEVDARVREIAESKKRRAARIAEYNADLIEKREGKKPGALDWDHAPCIVARWTNQLDEKMIESCGAFVAKWDGRAPADEVSKIVAARFFVILAMSERGEFRKAKPLADKLMADSDEWDTELSTLMGTWPTD